MSSDGGAASAVQRTSMARDLHDVIAAHLSTTAIHSGAALALPPDTERDRAALREVRASGLAALQEMRSMILLLRAEGAGTRDTVAAAGLQRLPDLLHSATAGGLAVQADVSPVAGLSALVDHTAYRIVQEALTNARKHAPDSRVLVRVRAHGDHMAVTVTNTLTLESDRVDDRALSTGTGLMSMRERAALVGGELTAGADDGLWRVQARLPLHAPGEGDIGRPA